jgi:hypothetical protein
VGRDIFNGIALFHRSKHCSIAYNKLFLEKSPGPTFANIGSLGWGLQFYSYEKNKLDSRSGRQSSQRFTFATTYASAVPGVAAIMVQQLCGSMT